MRSFSEKFAFTVSGSACSMTITCDGVFGADVFDRFEVLEASVQNQVFHLENRVCRLHASEPNRRS